MTIKKAHGGYIIHDDRVSNCNYGDHIFKNLEECFDYLLLQLEGRGRFFGGNRFGKVVILDKPTEKYPEVEPA